MCFQDYVVASRCPKGIGIESTFVLNILRNLFVAPQMTHSYICPLMDLMIDMSECLKKMETCVGEIREWMRKDMLKPSDEKTEVIFLYICHVAAGWIGHCVNVLLFVIIIVLHCHATWMRSAVLNTGIILHGYTTWFRTPVLNTGIVLHCHATWMRSPVLNTGNTLHCSAPWVTLMVLSHVSLLHCYAPLCAHCGTRLSDTAPSTGIPRYYSFLRLDSLVTSSGPLPAPVTYALGRQTTLCII